MSCNETQQCPPVHLMAIAFKCFILPIEIKKIIHADFIRILTLARKGHDIFFLLSYRDNFNIK